MMQKCLSDQKLLIKMSRKRLLEEADKFDSIENAIPNASIYGALSEVSPLKKGKNSVYFDGSITDGISFMRVVGFSAEQQQKVAAYVKRKA